MSEESEESEVMSKERMRIYGSRACAYRFPICMLRCRNGNFMLSECRSIHGSGIWCTALESSVYLCFAGDGTTVRWVCN